MPQRPDTGDDIEGVPVVQTTDATSPWVLDTELALLLAGIDIDRLEDLRAYSGGRVLFEFLPDDMEPEDITSGDVSASDVFNRAITEYINVEEGPVLLVPPGDYLIDDTLETISAVGAEIATRGYGVTTLQMASSATSARFFNIDGGSGPSAQHVEIGGFAYSYEDTPVDSEAVVRFGKAAECSVNGGYLANAAAAVLWDSGGGSRNTARGFRGRIDSSLGGNWFENRGQPAWRVLENQINSGDTDGAGQGGGMIVIAPIDNDVVDAGWVLYNVFQGPNTQGPDWGLRIDGTDAKAINNQWIIDNTTDHCTQFGIDYYAAPGSVCQSRNIVIAGHRAAGDGGANFRFLWEAENLAEDIYCQTTRTTYRVSPRPVVVSASRNNFELNLELNISNGAPGDTAPSSITYTFGCGAWIARGRAREGGTGTPTKITAAAEANPYKIWQLDIDAAGGTYDLAKAGVTTGLTGIAYNGTAASLATKLTTAYGTTMVVEGGTGGTYGPLRTRLTVEYNGETTMHLLDTSGMPASGTVLFGGLSAEVDYTSISGNDLLGCTGFAGPVAVGTAVFVKDAAEGPGTSYIIIAKGTYAPTANTAPGFGATADVPALTVDDSGLTGPGLPGTGRGIATLVTLKYANPLSNYDWWDWGVVTELANPANPPFLDCELGYTTGYAL